MKVEIPIERWVHRNETVDQLQSIIDDASDVPINIVGDINVKLPTCAKLNVRAQSF
jgi:hypothetical protein